MQSKINRAVRAHLIAQGVGTVLDTFSAPTADDRILPNTTILTGELSEETKYTGNWRGLVMVSLRDEAAIQPGEINPNLSWVAANTRLTNISNVLRETGTNGLLTYTALALTAAGRAMAVSDGSAEGDLLALDNADMADFTCFWFSATDLRPPTRNEEGTFWESELAFDVVACNGIFN